MRRPFALLVIASAAAARLLAQPDLATPLRLARLASPVAIDGDVSDHAWSTVTPLPLVMYQPTAGAEPSNRSEVRVGYDDDGIVASGRFWVDDPSQIRAASLTRDRVGADDLFRIMLDTFNDRENAVNFMTTPAGNRIDFATAADGQQINFDWNSHWRAASRRLPDGWSAEIRIPFSTLRFRSQDGRVVMRLLIERWSTAKNEMGTFPAISPDFASAQWKSSLAREIVLEGVEPRQPVYLTPYTLAGRQRTVALPPGAARFEAATDGRFEAGVDLKYGIGSDLALDLTVNTDFAQVEADDQQVNLTRFGLFFPEKRQFFQERAGVFAFNTGSFGDASRLFHSRRIGLDPTGRPLRIYGGGRIVGRAGDWDLGGLAMQVERGDQNGSEHFGVYRARRAILNSQSYLGAIATLRTGGDVTSAAYGVDAQVRTFRNDFLSAQWAQTFNGEVEEKGTSAGMARVVYERRSARGLVYMASAKWSGRDHDPGIGFNPRRDFVTAVANLRYGWYPGTKTVLRNIQPSLLANAFWRNEDGGLDSRFVATFLNYEFKSGISGFLQARSDREVLVRPLTLGPSVTVPTGRYDSEGFTAFVSMPGGRRLRANASVTVSDLYGGRSLFLSASPTWNVSEGLELGGDFTRQRVDFESRGERLEVDLYRVRVRAALNPRLSFNTYLQYNRLADQVVANLRVRYNVAEGSDLYIALDDRINTDRERFLPTTPILPWSQERAFTIKYSHTLIP